MNKASRSARLVSVSGDADGPIDPEKLARGQAIKAKRLALGITSLREFEEAQGEGGVGRDTIARAEEGKASRGTYDRLEAFLAEFDHEMSSEREEMGVAATKDAPETVDMIELTVSIGALGWSASAKGPKADADVLTAQLAELMAQAMRETKGE